MKKTNRTIEAVSLNENRNDDKSSQLAQSGQDDKEHNWI